MPAFNFFLFGSSILLILIAGVILWRSGIMQAETGLPAGKVVYADDERWYEQHEPLSAPDLRLTGKPDYLVEQPNGMIIPVEIKSRTAPVNPHDGHVFQLAAYCMLVWREFGVRPEFGILQYEDNSFEIEFDDALENDLLDLLAEMREDMFDDDLLRDHDDWRRCRRCGVREFCDDRLD